MKQKNTSTASLVEHLFRYEYGSLVASLVHRVGFGNIDSVEDAVQYAMMQALDYWPRQEVPKKPSAWLYQVAYRQLISEFRSSKRKSELLAENNQGGDNHEQLNTPDQSQMDDSMLRMLYIACNETIPIKSQLVFTLKNLCGFSVKEIAIRLFISQANVYKRYGRAKENLQEQMVELDDLTPQQMAKRLPIVHSVLYLLFTEGHLSSHNNRLIRQDLCEEAIRLMRLISQSTIGNIPQTSALLALMFLHLSRMDARHDASGEFLMLEQQDRNHWNSAYIKMGLSYLELSAKGESLSRYHIEASIAAEHCLAPSFELTRWDRIVASYKLLEHTAPSSLNRLNQALAMAEWQGAKAGLEILDSLNSTNYLKQSYFYNAVMADLQFRSGENGSANKSAELALQNAPTDNIKKLLLRRFEKYNEI